LIASFCPFVFLVFFSFFLFFFSALPSFFMGATDPRQHSSLARNTQGRDL
jgi:hypothetical protein